jgi:hypothetical protein
MDSKWIVSLSGKDYPLWAGILAEGHDRGLLSIETQIIQVPGEANQQTAIVRAKVTMKDGSFFEGIGDACPKNVKPGMVTAILRMAETRAKGRALRDAINCGQTMLEELPDQDDAQPAAGPQKAPGPVRYAPGTVATTPVTAAGFEPEYATGTKTYRRADMVRQCLQYQEQAREEGIAFEPIDPTKTPNAELFNYGRNLRPKLTVKAAMKDGVQGAAETVLEVSS